MPRLARSSKRSLGATIIVAAVAVVAMSTAALAAFTAMTSSPGNSLSAERMNAGNTPTFTLSGRDVTVTWTASLLSDATTTAQNYTIAKTQTTPNLGTVAFGTGSTCMGSVGALSCVDTTLPENGTSGSTFSYSDTPHYATWNGPASTAGTLTVPAPSESLTATSFTADGGTTSASIASFFDSESVHFCLDGDGTTFACSAGTPIGTATIPATGGSASGVTITIPGGTGTGGHTVYAIGNAGSHTTGTSINVSAGAPHTVAVVSGSGQSAAVSTALANPLVAKVTDSSGNPVPGVSVTFAAPSSSASGTFASTGCTSNPHTYSCVSTTAANGQATSSAFTANATPGTYNVSATATGGTNPSVNFSETNTPAAPTIAVTSPTSGTTYGPNASAWNNACKGLLGSSSATNAMCGTDSATSPATVSSVTFTLTRDDPSTQCWNGSSWVSGTACVANAATLVSGGIWKTALSFATLVNGQTASSTGNYTLTVTVTDSNSSTAQQVVAFKASN